MMEEAAPPARAGTPPREPSPAARGGGLALPAAAAASPAVGIGTRRKRTPSGQRIGGRDGKAHLQQQHPGFLTPTPASKMGERAAPGTERTAELTPQRHGGRPSPDLISPGDSEFSPFSWDDDDEQQQQGHPQLALPHPHPHPHQQPPQPQAENRSSELHRNRVLFVERDRAGAPANIGRVQPPTPQTRRTRSLPSMDLDMFKESFDPRHSAGGSAMLYDDSAQPIPSRPSYHGQSSSRASPSSSGASYWYDGRNNTSPYAMDERTHSDVASLAVPGSGQSGHRRRRGSPPQNRRLANPGGSSAEQFDRHRSYQAHPHTDYHPHAKTFEQEYSNSYSTHALTSSSSNETSSADSTPERERGGRRVPQRQHHRPRRVRGRYNRGGDANLYSASPSKGRHGGDALQLGHHLSHNPSLGVAANAAPPSAGPSWGGAVADAPAVLGGGPLPPASRSSRPLGTGGTASSASGVTTSFLSSPSPKARLSDGLAFQRIQIRFRLLVMLGLILGSVLCMLILANGSLNQIQLELNPQESGKGWQLPPQDSVEFTLIPPPRDLVGGGKTMVGIATHEAEDRYGGIRGVGKKLTDGIPRKTKPDTEKATEGDGDKTKGTADLAKVAIDGAKSSGVVATAGAGKEKDDGDDERKEETEKPKKRKRGFPKVDSEFYASSNFHPIMHGGYRRIINIDHHVDHTRPPSHELELYPFEFSDNTQYYPVIDSDDERARKMELRQPYEDETCAPMHDWQVTYHPSCNGMHELDAENGHNEREGKDLELFGTKGFWRHAWRLDLPGPRRRRDEPDSFVLKTLKYSHNFEDNFEEHDRIDAAAMERLTASPHVIDIYGFCGHAVITEFADGPRLGTLADKSKKTPLKRLEIARDIASGLADVHGIDGDEQPSFVHLDINPANVVAVGDTLKLNDFNIGILLKKNKKTGDTCGFPAQFSNPQWRSPEEARNEQDLTEKVDVFSMGHIFFRLICGHEPWNKLEPGGRPASTELTSKVQEGVLPFIPEDVMLSEDPEVVVIRETMLDCYTADAKERPSARTIANRLDNALKELAADLAKTGKAVAMEKARATGPKQTGKVIPKKPNAKGQTRPKPEAVSKNKTPAGATSKIQVDPKMVLAEIEKSRVLDKAPEKKPAKVKGILKSGAEKEPGPVANKPSTEKKKVAIGAGAKGDVHKKEVGIGDEAKGDVQKKKDEEKKAATTTKK